MSEQLSNRQTTLMMDYGTGMKQVDGLSDDDPPIELPELELLKRPTVKTALCTSVAHLCRVVK